MAHIAIIGSGFVGQATGKTLSQQGHSVVFVDIDKKKLTQLKKEGYITSSPETFQDPSIDLFFIAVPTPAGVEGVDLSFIQAAVKTLGQGPLRRSRLYPIVVVKSTVPPGTIAETVVPILEQSSHKKVGKDFGVAMEPEYLREKTSLADASHPRLILIGGADPHAASVLEWLRLPFHRPILHVRPAEAEMQKYVHNLWNATKISFFNEMRALGQALDMDTETIFDITTETAEAFWNPRYGIRDMGPFDGSCLPKDTAGFFRWAQETLDYPLPLLEAVIRVNETLQSSQRKEVQPEPLSLRTGHKFIEFQFHLAPQKTLRVKRIKSARRARLIKVSSPRPRHKTVRQASLQTRVLSPSS